MERCSSISRSSCLIQFNPFQPSPTFVRCGSPLPCLPQLVLLCPCLHQLPCHPCQLLRQQCLATRLTLYPVRTLCVTKDGGDLCPVMPLPLCKPCPCPCGWTGSSSGPEDSWVHTPTSSLYGTPCVEFFGLGAPWPHRANIHLFTVILKYLSLE